MIEKIRDLITASAQKIGLENPAFELTFTENLEHGDLSSNVALVNAKKLQMPPLALAEKIMEGLKAHKTEIISSIKIAGPGFINFYINDSYLIAETIKNSNIESNNSKKEQIIIEHTDPNTFKPIHIGHLMANAIGESLARLQASKYKVIRYCYPSDIGLHIAKSIWAILKYGDIPAESSAIKEKTAYLGKMYVKGTEAYDSDVSAKKEIDELNKIIYEKSDPKINEWFEKGKAWSMEHFHELLKILGSDFDEYYFESQAAPSGKEIVKSNMGKIFSESEGAVIFAGEKFGLHTRVFLNSQGLPTYEAKELGLNIAKFQKYPQTAKSIIVTANEQNAYFQVISKVLNLLNENIGAKTVHIGHGLLRFASGKMSSRTGKVVQAEDLIGEIKMLVQQKMSENNERPDAEVANIIAVAAIKYTILRQAIGTDVIFDSAKSISFEGDSGPYLQYSAVRAKAVLKKSVEQNIDSTAKVLPEQAGSLEHLLIRFPYIVERSREEYSPQYVANYLIALAGEFNSFYGRQIILDEKNPLSQYYVALTGKFLQIITEGLDLLGIKVPERM